MKKYIFKTFSKDPRPIKEIHTWFVIGIGQKEGKSFWEICAMIPNQESSDIFQYWEEAYEITLAKDQEFSNLRGNKYQVIPALRQLNFMDGIDFLSNEIHPTTLYVISKLSEKQVSDSEMARRLGVSLPKWKTLKKNNEVKIALKEGYLNYIEKVKSNL
jgi:hypothetical protein